MKLLVCGPRHFFVGYKNFLYHSLPFKIRQLIREDVKTKLVYFLFSHPEFTELITGDAVGIDRLAETIVRQDRRLSYIKIHRPIRPDYDRYPKYLKRLAPLRRNTQLVEVTDSTLGFIELKKSNGTMDTIVKTIERGKQHYLIQLDCGKWNNIRPLTKFLN